MTLGSATHNEMTQASENVKHKPSAEAFLTLPHDHGSRNTFQTIELGSVISGQLINFRVSKIITLLIRCWEQQAAKK